MQQEELQLTPEQLQQIQQAEADGIGLEAIISAILLAWIVSELARVPGSGSITRTAVQTARAIAWLNSEASSSYGQSAEEAVYQRLEQAIKPRVLSSVSRLRNQLGNDDPAADRALVDGVVGPGLRRNRLFDSLIGELRKALSENASAGRTDIYERKSDGSGALGVESWAKRLANMIGQSILNDARDQAARESGGSRKVWISRADDRVRSTHRILHMERRDALEPFKVAGQEIMFPGDVSAPIDLWANCRCVMLWLK
jgi:hypothetical protein